MVGGHKPPPKRCPPEGSNFSCFLPPWDPFAETKTLLKRNGELEGQFHDGPVLLHRLRLQHVDALRRLPSLPRGVRSVGSLQWMHRPHRLAMFNVRFDAGVETCSWERWREGRELAPWRGSLWNKSFKWAV